MPKHFVSLCSLPTTALLQSYCTAAYLEEMKEKQANGEINIENSEANKYTVSMTHLYKKTFVWHFEAMFEVQEFEEPTLILTGIKIYADDQKDLALHLVFKYNTNPKSFQYQWGQFIEVKEISALHDSYYMLTVAALQDSWLHNLVFAKATRRTIHVKPKHMNQKPSLIHDLAPIINALQEKIDIRVAAP